MWGVENPRMISNVLTEIVDFEAPEDDFSRIFRGSSEIVDFGFFYDFRQFSGDPPEFIKILFFDNFQWIRGFIESAGAGPLQHLLKYGVGSIRSLGNSESPASEPSFL